MDEARQRKVLIAGTLLKCGLFFSNCRAEVGISLCLTATLSEQYSEKVKRLTGRSNGLLISTAAASCC